LQKGETDVTSFLSLVEVHEHLNELFLTHQEALLADDMQAAAARLAAYEQLLRAHMNDEEARLLPVYERAGRIQGGAVEFFTGEHRKMLEMLARIREQLARIGNEPTARDRIRLFDEESRYKLLVEHHDQREQNILYPTLDRITDDAERLALLRQCTAPPGR
jgi:hemerythrin-like domain-containing protein